MSNKERNKEVKEFIRGYVKEQKKKGVTTVSRGDLMFAVLDEFPISVSEFDVIVKRSADQRDGIARVLGGKYESVPTKAEDFERLVTGYITKYGDILSEEETE